MTLVLSMTASLENLQIHSGKIPPEEQVSQFVHNGKGCRTQLFASVIPFEIPFPPVPFENCHGWAISLKLITEHESSFSLIDPYLIKVSLLSTDIASWILGFWAEKLSLSLATVSQLFNKQVWKEYIYIYFF